MFPTERADETNVSMTRDTGKKKVLIVDDEMDMRIYLSTMFEVNGHLPIVARNGKDGIKKAREMLPDLIILDVMMPGEGGVLMYRQLKSDEKLTGIPVIMLSAVKRDSFSHYLSMLRTRLQVEIAQPDAYLEKPPDHEELLNAALKLLK